MSPKPAILALLCTLAAGACKDDDPLPDGPKGAFQIWGTVKSAEGTALDGYTKIELSAARVDIEVVTEDGVVRHTVVPEPFPLTVFPDIGPTFVLQFESPAGQIQRVVLVRPTGTVHFGESRTSPLVFASGDLSFEPERGVEWRVGADKYTAGRVDFDPASDIAFEPATSLRPRARFRAIGQLDGPAFDISFATTGTIAGLALVAFEAGTSASRIAEIHAGVGARVVDVSRDGARQVIELPYSVSLRGAAEHYGEQPEFVAGSLATVGRPALTDDPKKQLVVPNDGDPGNVSGDDDPATGNQISHTFASIPEAWRIVDLQDNGVVDGTIGMIGTRRLRVAVIDGRFQLDHPEIVPNFAIHQAEIPVEMAASILDHDDRPDVISFRDLNHPDNACPQAEGPCPCYVDLNPNAYEPDTDSAALSFMVDICDPLDLFMDTRWMDEIDQDGNTLVDDLVGYAFGNAEAEESPDGHHGRDAEHGTAVVGIVAALGDNRPGGLYADVMSFGHDTIPDSNPGLAGVLWHADVIPIGANLGGLATEIPNHWPQALADDEAGDVDIEDVLDNGTMDFDVYEAIEYAVSQGADIIVAPIGSEFLQRDAWEAAVAGLAVSPSQPDTVLGGPECKQPRVHVIHADAKTFKAMMEGGKQWWGSVDFGNSVMFMAAGNCALDWGDDLLESPYVEYLDPTQTVAVAAMIAAPAPNPPLYMTPAVAPYTSFGTQVELATMTDIFSLRLRGRSLKKLGGTSSATPLAAGGFGLFLLSRIASDPDFMNDTTAAERRQLFLDVSRDPNQPTPTIGDGTSFMNVKNAVTP